MKSIAKKLVVLSLLSPLSVWAAGAFSVCSENVDAVRLPAEIKRDPGLKSRIADMIDQQENPADVVAAATIYNSTRGRGVAITRCIKLINVCAGGLNACKSAALTQLSKD